MSKLACLGRVVSVLGAMLSPSIGGAQSPPLQELDAVAMIRVFAPSTGQTRKEGSGILLGADGFVLTARHVVGDVDRATERITVTFISASGNPIEAEFRNCAAGDSDVCLLKIPESAVRAAGVTAFPRLNCRRLEVNDMVLAVGWPNPANMELDRVSGTITGGLATGVLYPTSATALPGMSGGPVYDQTDTVVGLVKGGLEPTQTRVLLVPLFSVRDLIEQTPEDCPTILTEKDDALLVLTHNQQNWKNFVEGVGGVIPDVRQTSTIPLDEDPLASRAALIVLAMPFNMRIEASEVSFLKRYVSGGGSLLLLGYYAPRHHKSNFNDIAGEFGISCNDDLVMPATSDAGDTRRHVLQRSKSLGVTAKIDEAGDHPITSTGGNAFFISSCSLTAGFEPAAVIRAEGISIWKPVYEPTGGGADPSIIIEYQRSQESAASLLLGFTFGRGKVAAVGTWKIFTTANIEDNARLLANVTSWLRKRS